MTTTIEKEFRSLTVAERVDLLGELWREVASKPAELPVPKWQLEELDRRRLLYRANPQRAVPWAEAKARILKRHAKRHRPT